LKEINQKIMNFNIFKFEKSDIIKMKDISYSNPNNFSFNDNNLSNNSDGKAKEIYGSFYNTFEINDYPLTSNKISVNNTNNNNNNDLNIIYNSSFLFNFNEDSIKSFMEAVIYIFSKLNIYINTNKISENYFECFLEGINKLFIILDDKSDFSDSNIFSSIEEIENKSTNSSITSDANIKVESIKQLEYNKINSHSIVSISLNHENLKSISIFNDYELTNLKKLELRGNNIIDISPLLNSSLYLLEELDLEDNEIDNKCIDVLKKVKMDFLYDLNLYKNKIATIKIFEISGNLKSLKILYIGYNPLSEDKMKTNKKEYLLPNALDELGLTANFNNESIYFIRFLNLENLKILYLNNNYLTSLKCIKIFYFLRLEEFWATENLLTDINEIENINNKKTIKKICLNGNKISVIDDKFLNLLVKFTKLTTINLKNNPVSKNDEMIKIIRNAGVKVDI